MQTEKGKPSYSGIAEGFIRIDAKFNTSHCQAH